ncbi:MAG: rod-binding protein [Phycisphaerae bacterium]|nr:rod-binding protein [Phycisphaerae bacterium]
MSDPITSISPASSVAGAEPMLEARFRALAGNAKPTAEELKKVARDFEGVFLEKLLQEMQNTIPDSGMFSGAGMKQIKSMFWSFLADQVAQNGGIGLAQSLYRDLCVSAGVDPAGAAGNSTPRRQVAKFIEAASETNSPTELKP